MGEEQSTSRGVPTAGTPLDVDGARLLRPLTELEVRRLGVVRRFFAVHPVASDVLVCLMVAGASALGMTVSFTAGAVGGDGTPFYVVQAVAALLGLVAIAVRRRWPLAVLGAITGVIAVSLLLPAGLGLPAGDAALPFALYAVAANRRPAVAWSAFATVVAVLTGAFALTTHSALATELGPVLSVDSTSGASTPVPGWGPFSGLALASLLSYTIVGLIYLAVGLSVYGQRQQVADLVRRSHELVAAGQQQARLASMQERTRIARELHDVVAHSLSVMVALSDGARASVRRAPESAEQALDLAAETGRTALADMRRMLGVLRDGTGVAAGADRPDAGGPGTVGPAATGVPSAFGAAPPGAGAGSREVDVPPHVVPADTTVQGDQPAPTAPQPTAGDDLDALVDGFRGAGLPVRSRTTELPDHAGLRLAVFRVVQESLTNVLRHAPGAGAVDVLVVVVSQTPTSPALVQITVTDDGGARMPGAGAGSGRGLVGMRERAAVFGGTATAGPYRGGWRVSVELVVPADAGPRPSQVWAVPA